MIYNVFGGTLNLTQPTFAQSPHWRPDDKTFSVWSL